MTYSTKFNPSTLHALLPFVSRDETRYNLNGILVTRHDGKIKLVATDARRLIVHEPEWTQANEMADVLIPRQAIEALPKDAKASWALTIEDGWIAFGGSSFLIRCGAMDATPVNWRSVIPDPLPTDFPRNPFLNRRFIAEAVEAMDALDGEEVQLGVKLLFGTGCLVMKAEKTLILVNGMTES